MKIAIAIFILVLCGPGNAAAASPRTRLQANDPIDPIRQHYANINQNVSSYRRVKKELWGFSPEGGELVAYFHGPTLMKIVATFLGETGRAVEEYYFWDGKVMFVLSTDNRYDKPFGKVVRKNETRLYFKQDKLIRWLGEDGKEVAPDSSEYTTKQADYLKLSKLLSDGAKSKARKIESPD
jgi:hypothetical protein